MRTIEFLTQNGAAYWWPVLAALLTTLLGGVLSVAVVLKRLAFIGQGVSHAAFGGVGLALLAGVGVGSAAGDLVLLLVLIVFGVGAALGIDLLARSRSARGPGAAGGADTAIGIVLAVSMAMGFVLYRLAAREAVAGGRPAPPGIESVLFGDILSVGPIDVLIAGATLVAGAGVLWGYRGPRGFAGCEPEAAEAFGVRVRALERLLLVLAAVAIVVAVRTAGVVLASAIFVLPAATALRLSNRLSGVMVWSLAVAALGAIGGVVLSFEAGWSTGPSIVLALGAAYGAARVWNALRAG